MMFCRRKNKIFWAISLLIIIFMVLCEYQPSSEHEIADKSQVLTFSKEPGFYEEEFELEINTAFGTIYYTLDGTLPDRNSLKYEKPLLITDATTNENRYSMITDVSAGFYSEEIEKFSDNSSGYLLPDYKIDKATIVRAVAYNETGQHSEIKTAAYFVGFSQKDGYEGMNILSIVTEPSNLFDYETGIYVTGKGYDDYVKEYRNRDEFYWKEEFWSLWGANYRNRGIKWERKASCQFFDSSGKLVCDQECGIRIHGESSRGYNPKSLNIYAREEYDGNKFFQEDFWGTGYYASAAILSQGGNDVKTKAKDFLVSEAIKDLDVATMNYEPYVLFLDGEYWGWYWLNEKYNADYLEHRYHVDKDNIIMIKNGQLEEGEEEDYLYFQKMIEFCSQSDVTNNENYGKVCEMIDIESYMDYYAVMLYVGRHGDWPDSNYALWRVKKKENSPYGDSKWRWMVFDLNSPGFEVGFDSLEYVMENDPMFKNLMTNDNFRTQLFLKIEELADTIFSFETWNKRIDKYQDFINDPMINNNKRFFGDDSLADFNNEIEILKLFWAERKDFLMPALNDYK